MPHAAGIWLPGTGKAPSMSFEEYAYGENRYRVLKKSAPEKAAALMQRANAWTTRRFALYEQMAALSLEEKTAD